MPTEYIPSLNATNTPGLKPAGLQVANDLLDYWKGTVPHAHQDPESETFQVAKALTLGAMERAAGLATLDAIAQLCQTWGFTVGQGKGTDIGDSAEDLPIVAVESMGWVGVISSKTFGGVGLAITYAGQLMAYGWTPDRGTVAVEILPGAKTEVV